MGCMNKVFRGEIDVELFEQAERTRHGFGGVKMTGLPLPQCRASVERAYDGYTEAFDCVNPGFFDEAGVDDWTRGVRPPRRASRPTRRPEQHRLPHPRPARAGCDASGAPVTRRAALDRGGRRA